MTSNGPAASLNDSKQGERNSAGSSVVIGRLVGIRTLIHGAPLSNTKLLVSIRPSKIHTFEQYTSHRKMVKDSW